MKSGGLNRDGGFASSHPGLDERDQASGTVDFSAHDPSSVDYLFSEATATTQLIVFDVGSS